MPLFGINENIYPSCKQGIPEAISVLKNVQVEFCLGGRSSGLHRVPQIIATTKCLDASTQRINVWLSVALGSPGIVYRMMLHL